MKDRKEILSNTIEILTVCETLAYAKPKPDDDESKYILQHAPVEIARSLYKDLTLRSGLTTRGIKSVADILQMMCESNIDRES